VRYVMTTSGPNARGSTTAVAGRDRRLVLRVPLGPSGSGPYTTSVTIARGR
jgi:hypothetical protein